MLVLNFNFYCKYYGKYFIKQNNHFYMPHLGCVINENKFIYNTKDSNNFSLKNHTEITTDIVKEAVDNIKLLIKNELCNKKIFKIKKNNNDNFNKYNLVHQTLNMEDFTLELDYQINILAFNIFCKKIMSSPFRIVMYHKNDLNSIKFFIDNLLKIDLFYKQKIQDIINDKNKKQLE